MRIETERLIIRKFTSQNIDLIFDINNNPECIKFNSWDSIIMLSSVDKFPFSLDRLYF
ncbi:hypothetical protein [Clostridium tagluense]|uniref:hypothetical protein n=1 Tax=Clostridium tagluense TaxID=360422 RepID=UPI001CF3DF47|nr:hypothetical protein [Clostridium tagluense]MCB2297879.1 hypothetical protein [Clostridium tagluense]